MTEDFEKQRIAAHQALDGTDRAAVKLLTGLTDEQIEDLGGMP
jgi:hypothetical protein